MLALPPRCSRSVYCLTALVIIACQASDGSADEPTSATDLPVAAAQVGPAPLPETPGNKNSASRNPSSGKPSSDWQDYLDLSRISTPGRSIPVAETPDQVRPLLLQMILNGIPHDYDNTKKWGGKREVWNGLRVDVDGVKIKTKRRKKKVNHGTWKRYQITLVDPEDNVQIKLDNIREDATGKVAFDVHLAAKLDTYGRIQEWNRGVRLFSISAEATADVALTMTCLAATQVDITKIPPDLVFELAVTAADLRLRDFKLHRISKADGPVVRDLSHSVEQIVRDHLAERNHKLVAKLNRQIEKKADDLRISVSDIVQGKLLGTSADPVD